MSYFSATPFFSLYHSCIRSLDPSFSPSSHLKEYQAPRKPLQRRRSVGHRSCMLQRSRQVDETRLRRMKILRWISEGRVTSIGAVVSSWVYSNSSEKGFERTVTFLFAHGWRIDCFQPRLLRLRSIIHDWSNLLNRKPERLSASDGVCSLVAIVSTNLNTIEGDGFVEIHYSW